MAKMRFEFNSEMVDTMLNMIYDILSFDGKTTIKVNKSYFDRIEKLAKKIRIYSKDAFQNRDKYREEMRVLFNFLEESKKNIKLVSK